MPDPEQTGLKPGDAAPPFSLVSDTGKTVALADFQGRRAVVLYFYPKDDTPGCTKEACAFRDAKAPIEKVGAAVLGISLDSVASHQRFIQKYALTFPLLSDPDSAVSTAYGVYKLKNMYGRTSWGIERATFIINTAGRIAHIFRRVKVDGHVEAVLAALKAMDQRQP